MLVPLGGHPQCHVIDEVPEFPHATSSNSVHWTSADGAKILALQPH